MDCCSTNGNNDNNIDQEDKTIISKKMVVKRLTCLPGSSIKEVRSVAPRLAELVLLPEVRG
jgi:hypothetical protein